MLGSERLEREGETERRIFSDTWMQGRGQMEGRHKILRTSKFSAQRGTKNKKLPPTIDIQSRDFLCATTAVAVPVICARDTPRCGTCVDVEIKYLNH